MSAAFRAIASDGHLFGVRRWRAHSRLIFTSVRSTVEGVGALAATTTTVQSFPNPERSGTG